jgi:5-methylcytosine-specific restriction endonuclease McrA
MATKKHPLTHAAALLPLAIGLGMNATATKTHHATQATSSNSTEVCEDLGIDASASEPFTSVPVPSSKQCHTGMSHDLPIPDPSCTPGAIDPTVTEEVLKDSRFRTKCIRNLVTSASKKNSTYDWYGLNHPSNNTGATQTCELDHLVPLELGGADTLDNIWPQCGPDDVGLASRFFKRKDAIENFLTSQVKAGKMSLNDAQHGIATDWTQYIIDGQECEDSNCDE